MSLSNINPSTLLKNSVSSLSGSVNVSKGVGEQAWVNNQTSLIGRNGGSINVDGTLTNTGAIIGSQSIDSPMIINATEIITTDLKDKDYNKNIGIGVSNITAKLNVPQTDVQYGMGDKRQDTNATFTNTIAYEGGVKVDFDARDINTSLENAQLITRDKTIDQINTSLHTDMLNKDVRQNFVIDFLKTTTLLPQVAKGIGEGLDKNNSYNIFGQLANNLGKNGFNIVSYATGVEKELKDLIADNLNGNGELNLTEYNMEEISSILLPLLKEYGKDFYDIEFVEDYGHPSGMSISDSEGTIFLNVRGQGFGDARSMLEQLGHEGLHGTYANRDVDEAAARQLTNYAKMGPGIGVDISSVRGQIKISTDRYNEARMNGDLRDAPPVILGVALTGKKVLTIVGIGSLYSAKKTYEKHGDFDIFSDAERAVEFFKDLGIGVTVTGTAIILLPAAGAAIASTGTVGATAVTVTKVGGSVVITGASIGNAISSSSKGLKAFEDGHYGATLMYTVDGTLSIVVAYKSGQNFIDGIKDVGAMYFASNGVSTPGKIVWGKLEKMPTTVQDSYAAYAKNKWTHKSKASDGTRAGRLFKNDKDPIPGKRAKLPVKNLKGDPITYKEYDVNDKIVGKGRGDERFVRGSDGSVYYTSDHYKGFIRLE